MVAAAASTCACKGSAWHSPDIALDRLAAKRARAGRGGGVRGARADFEKPLPSPCQHTLCVSVCACQRACVCACPSLCVCGSRGCGPGVVVMLWRCALQRLPREPRAGVVDPTKTESNAKTHARIHTHTHTRTHAHMHTCTRAHVVARRARQLRPAEPRRSRASPAPRRPPSRARSRFRSRDASWRRPAQREGRPTARRRVRHTHTHTHTHPAKNIHTAEGSPPQRD